MRSACFISVLIVIQWFDICQSEETTLGSDIESLLPSKHPKFYVVLLPPIFSVIGVTLIVISILTTIFCCAYCVFLPWAHALSNKKVIREVVTASPSIAGAANTLNQQPPFAGAIPPHPYYAGGSGPYFPNQPYPYYAGPQPPTININNAGPTAATKSEPSSEPTTSPPPHIVRETETFTIENL